MSDWLIMAMILKKQLWVLELEAYILADTTEEAIKRYRPYYDIYMNTDASKFNQSPFKDLEDHIQNGSALVGSADQVIEKILKYYEAYGHQVRSISVEG